MFYKIVDNQLIYGTTVQYVNYFQLGSNHINDYPIDGWYWFSTVEQAKEFFGISEKVDVL